MHVRRPQFGFLHHGFIDPDFMKCTFDWMLDDARLGLMKGCPMAYFWFASSRSDLYTFWAPRLEDMLDRPLTPASQQFRLVEFGLEPYPDAGISRLVIDTEDRTDRWYGDPGHAAVPLPAQGRRQRRRAEVARWGSLQWRPDRLSRRTLRPPAPGAQALPAAHDGCRGAIDSAPDAAPVGASRRRRARGLVLRPLPCPGSSPARGLAGHGP